MIILEEIFNWIGTALIAVGVWISILGYKRSKKTGYIFVAIAFSLSLVIGLIISPLVKVQRQKHPQQELSEIADLDEEISEAMLEARKQVLKKHGRPNPAPYMTVNVNYKIPLYEILLVSGLWLLVKKESN